MAVLPIVITGDPVLHMPATKVTDFGTSLVTLVSDMYQTMAAAPGVGVAAPRVSPPTIEELDDECESEGCLSIPGERFALRRSELAILRAVDIDQNPFEIEASGWLARIFQHEFDHLDGLLYSDRLAPAEAKVAAKVIRKSGWGLPGLSWLPGVDHPED
jgi:peptide deformylase